VDRDDGGGRRSKMSTVDATTGTATSELIVVSGPLSKVDRDLEDVASSIKRVEEEIAAVGLKIENTTDKEMRSYYMRKEEQLREKENKLHDEKNKLIDLKTELAKKSELPSATKCEYSFRFVIVV